MHYLSQFTELWKRTSIFNLCCLWELPRAVIPRHYMMNRPEAIVVYRWSPGGRGDLILNTQHVKCPVMPVVCATVCGLPPPSSANHTVHTSPRRRPTLQLEPHLPPDDVWMLVQRPRTLLQHPDNVRSVYLPSTLSRTPLVLQNSDMRLEL